MPSEASGCWHLGRQGLSGKLLGQVPSVHGQVLLTWAGVGVGRKELAGRRVTGYKNWVVSEKSSTLLRTKFRPREGLAWEPGDTQSSSPARSPSEVTGQPVAELASREPSQ